MHRRQGVSPGRTNSIIPYVETAPQYTHGLPRLTQASFSR
jgi:hypothetical protein